VPYDCIGKALWPLEQAASLLHSGAVRTATTFLAVLSIVAGGIFIAWSATWLLAPSNAGAARFKDSIKISMRPWAVASAWVIATTSTLGSLYYSEIANLEPCRLCWYQRIAMYPLVVVLGVAALRRDLAVRIYAAPLAIIGAGIAGYHYLIQWFPSLESGACGTGIPCSSPYVWRWEFLSIAFMALMGFLAVIALLFSTERTPYGNENADT